MAALRPQRLRIPASTSNLGPGFDALGVALGIGLEISWRPAERTTLTREGRLAESDLALGRDPVVRGMRRAAMLAGAPLPAGELTVSSTVPPGRGLGMSGAGLVGGLLLGNRITGKRVPDDELLAEAIRLEGNPENAVASFLGGAHWSIVDADGRWRHLPVKLHRELRFLFLVPPFPLDTARARKALPSSVPFARAVRQVHRAPALLAALASLDPTLLRAAIEDELVQPSRLRLLTGVGRVMDHAVEAGALAATLSGAGSAAVALVRRRDLSRVAAAMELVVRRLWGDDGLVLTALPGEKGARFVR